MAATICWFSAAVHSGLRLKKDIAMLLFNIEVNIRGVLAAGIRFIIGFLVKAEDAGKDIIGECLDFQVIVLYGGVEIPTGYVDAIFRAFDLGLKILELLRRLEIGIGFRDGHEPAEGALQLGLSALVLTEGGGVI